MEKGIFDIIFTLSFELGLLSNVFYKIIQYKNGYFVVSKDHPLAERKTLSFEDIGETPFLVIDERFSAGAKMIYDKWKSSSYTPSKIIYAPNIETLLSYVKLGMGITIFDSSIIKNIKESVKTFEVPNDTKAFSNVAVWNKNNMNPVLAHFLDEIKDVREKQL